MRKLNLLLIVATLLLSSCGVNWHVSTFNYDPIYEDENYIVVSEDIKVDTISSRWDFERKLRTDFNFRWDYANYMMNQPLSWYYRNHNWSPWGYGAHNTWFNSHIYWTDWAFNYPFTSFNSWYWDRHRWNRPWMGNVHYGWYSNTWNNHWYGYGWNHWYGHDSWRWGNYWRNDKTYVHINGRRGSNSVIYNRTPRNNSNIENNNINRRNNNSRIRTYENPNNSNNVIRNENIRVRPNNNNIRVNPPTNNNSRGINNRNYYTPPNRNINNTRSTRPSINNTRTSTPPRSNSSSRSGGTIKRDRR